ncbi:MAG TPA: glycosyltransferase, partial [Thermoanaerobaculia bacterium]|nr:glycosyltransferase [Thermoanaerobaculia bacterium]
MSRLALVIPCYNEEHRLPVDELRRFSVSGVDLELVLVNDGSGDGTLRLLESLHEENPSRFTVLNLAQNSGKAEAVRRGILAALDRKPDYVGFWDADLATPLSELPVFVEILDARPAVQMVMGARVRLL